MGCQSEVTIGDNLTFTVTTHNPTTGALTDADAGPFYRIYEEETGTTILADNMSKLDAVNTLGFYSEKILCSVASGYESGKSYSIYIYATVAGVMGGISYGFRALAKDCDSLNDLSAAQVTTAVEALESFKQMLAFARGKVVITGDEWAFYDTDDMTLLFTFTVTTAGRTVA